ncbi:MAG TPA: YggT family protein [Hymenobacter sp.]|jgi:uncharacterized membrane protein YeaQ/YmgE (transglycosylase-associated protein family)
MADVTPDLQRPNRQVYERQETEITTNDPTAAPVAPAAAAPVSGSNLAARIVRFIAGTIIGLLALRFLLSLLGANRGNTFADIIYGITYPFVSPFFGLFGYDATYGRSRFEFETLVAMLVYALLAMAIARALTIRNRTQG